MGWQQRAAHRHEQLAGDPHPRRPHQRGQFRSVQPRREAPGIRLLGRDDQAVEVATGREVHTLEGHTHLVYSVAFSPDGRLLASGSCGRFRLGKGCDQGEIKLWEVATGREVRILEGHTDLVNSVAFSPDGKLLASGSDDGTIKLWNISDLLGR